MTDPPEETREAPSTPPPSEAVPDDSSRLSLLRNRDFALLWWGGLFSLTGQATLSVALPAHVYLSTGSALATSLMFLAATLPRLLLSSLAGVFVDRWPRRRTLLVCNLLLAAVCLPLLAAWMTDGVWIVYLVAALQSSVTRFFEPAENALLPTLVPRSQLPSANALNALNNNLGRLVGAAAGGAVVAVAGLAGVVAMNVLLYLLAFALIASMRVGERPAGASPAGRRLAGLRGLAEEWLQGMRAIRRERVAMLLLAIAALTAVGEGIFGVLITPFVIDVLRAGPAELGLVRSVQGIGGIVGGLVIAWLGSRLRPRIMLGVGAVLFGLVDLAIFNYPRFYEGIAPALLLMVLVGVPGAAFGAGFATLLQTHVGGGLLGRVHGTLSTVASLAMLGGIALAGTLADRVGIVPVLNVQGFGYVAAGLMVLALLGPRWAVPPAMGQPADGATDVDHAAAERGP